MHLNTATMPPKSPEREPSRLAAWSTAQAAWDKPAHPPQILAAASRDGSRSGGSIEMRSLDGSGTRASDRSTSGVRRQYVCGRVVWTCAGNLFAGRLVGDGIDVVTVQKGVAACRANYCILEISADVGEFEIGRAHV